MGTRRRTGDRGHGWRGHAVLGAVLLIVSVTSSCAAPVPSPSAATAPAASDLPAGSTAPTPSVQAPSPAAPNPSSSVTPSAEGEWGPLAVLPPQDGADTARMEGTLRITGACTFLSGRGEPMLLMWPANRTAWDGETRTITFTNLDGSRVRVTDGSKVVLGGGGDSSAESGVPTEGWLEAMPWVARPADGCPLDPRWGVGEVAR